MMGLGTNRVLAAIERQRDRLEQGIKPDGTPITGDLDSLEASLALTPLEVVAYQNAQARAHVMGILTTEEAQTIYAAIGEGGDWAQGTDLATKVIVTQVIGELLARGRR
jgi:hypothetical protein